jgi:Tfp pilus assembly PilM family ATPase
MCMLNREFFLNAIPVPSYIDPVYAGIDISQSSIKCIVASRAGNHLHPIVISETLLPDGVMDRGTIAKEDHIVRVLDLARGEYSITHAYVTVPEEHAFVFPMRVRGIARSEQRLEVEFAMSEHVPIPLEHVVYDFLYIRDGLVSVTAYDKRVSSSYERVVSLAGITPCDLVPHICASANACVPRMAGKDRTSIVVDVGRTRTSLACVYEGVPVATATIFTGGKALLDALCVSGMTTDDARMALRTTGISALPAVTALIEEWIAQLRVHVDTWQSGIFYDEVRVAPPSAMYLCGGFADIPGLSGALSSVFRFPVNIANIWQNICTFSDFVPRVHKRESYKYASSVGLLVHNL